MQVLPRIQKMRDTQAQYSKQQQQTFERRATTTATHRMHAVPFVPFGFFFYRGNISASYRVLGRQGRAVNIKREIGGLRDGLRG